MSIRSSFVEHVQVFLSLLIFGLPVSLITETGVLKPPAITVGLSILIFSSVSVAIHILELCSMREYLDCYVLHELTPLYPGYPYCEVYLSRINIALLLSSDQSFIVYLSTSLT